MPALQKKHKKSSVHNIKSVMNTRYGAGDRTRTCTLLAVEPKSTESANSTTPAGQMLRGIPPGDVPISTYLPGCHRFLRSCRGHLRITALSVRR